MAYFSTAILVGNDAAKPGNNSALTEGRVYFATDTQKIYRDSGIAWVEVLAAAAGAGDVTYAQLLAMQLCNEIKGWPPLVNTGDLDALNLWFDKVGTPSTAPSVVAVSGEGITENYELALKVVADAAGEGLYQRFTYADEPRVKSGQCLSTLWAIWCVGGVGATLSIINSSAEETAAAKVTAAAWTIVEVPNHLLAGTYCDIKIVTDGAGTIYCVPLGANIGARGLPLKPRGLRYVENFASAYSGDPGGADWADLDLTSVTSPLAAIANLHVWYRNTTTVPVGIYVRRNGTSLAADALTQAVGNQITTAFSSIVNTFAQSMDDGQVIEWKSSGAASDAEVLNLAVKGYWEWK